METSAKASINVEEAFFTLARDIKSKMEKRMVCNAMWLLEIVNIYICGLLYFQEATNPPKGHQLKASEPNKKGAAHNWLSRCNLF